MYTHRDGFRRPSSTTFKDLFLWQIKARFHVKPPLEGGTKDCINGPGHITKMAALPIGMQHLALKLYKICVNGKWVYLDLFFDKVKFGACVFEWEKLIKSN